MLSVLSVKAAVFLYCSLENDGSWHGFSRCVISYFRLYPKGPDYSFNRVVIITLRAHLFYQSPVCIKLIITQKDATRFWDASCSTWNFWSRQTCCCALTSAEIMKLHLKKGPYVTSNSDSEYMRKSCGFKVVVHRVEFISGSHRILLKVTDPSSTSCLNSSLTDSNLLLKAMVLTSVNHLVEFYNKEISVKVNKNVL